jgi:hypothetical protein
MVPLPLHERLHAVKRLIGTRAQAAKFAPSAILKKFGHGFFFFSVSLAKFQ